MPGEPCVWLEGPAEYEVRGGVVHARVDSDGKRFHFCMSRATLRHMAECATRALNSADSGEVIGFPMERAG
jgi:hypothetical protein